MTIRFSTLCCVSWLVACVSAHGHGPDAAPATEPVHHLDGSTPAPEDDAAKSTSAPDVPSPPKLCDGTKDIRLMWQLDDEIRAIFYSFIVPYGSAIFAVDGQCRFHVLSDYREGYAVGALSADQEIELSRELAYAELLRVGSQTYYPAGGCADIPALVAATSEGTVRCGCGCPAETPEAIALALQTNAKIWLQRMLDQGMSPGIGAVSAVAIPRDVGLLPAAGEPWPWPLPQSMHDVPNLVLSGITDPRWNKGPYARIEDAEHVAALRALREANLGAKADLVAGTQVIERGETYRLFVRDELPEDVAQALKAFRDQLAAKSAKP